MPFSLSDRLVGIVLALLCAGCCVSVPMNNPKQGELHHRIFNHSYTGLEQWKVVAEIDGLKNEEVAMFLLGTGAKEYVYMRERIIPSARTWMRLLKNVFVIVEDTFDVRFAMRHCKVLETEHYTSFECHHEPVYVLSRKCTNEYYGAAGPCCKVDDAINYLALDRPDVYRNLKYFLHCDDDTYWRVDQVMRWLAAIENSGISSFPIVANPNPADLRKDPEHVWHIKNCKEILTNGWYQPLMMNRAALDRMKQASSVYGLTATCRNFVVTHDVGVGVHAWLFGIYHMQMVHTNYQFSEHKNNLDSELMVVHSLKHGKEDPCSDASNVWKGDTSQYDQHMVLGCGTIDKPSPAHDVKKSHADMYDAWNFFKEHGTEVNVKDSFGLKPWDWRNITVYPLEQGQAVTQIKVILSEVDNMNVKDGKFNGDIVERRYIPILNQLSGYSTTKHAKKYDIVKEWHEFTLADCDPAGVVE